MNFTVLLALSVLCVLVVAVKSEISLGGCPQTEAQKPFDLSKYAGLWYEIRKTPASFELGLKCNRANYTALDDGTIRVANQGQRKDGSIDDIVGSIDDIVGSARIADARDPARLLVKFPVSPVAAPYAIITTDYERYAVVLSCTDLVVANYAIMWVLSRTKELDIDTENELETFFGNHPELNYLINKFENTDQSNCN